MEQTGTYVSKLNKLARIENNFIFNARYQLNAREQKIILYLISNLDPRNQDDFHKQVVPLTELESLLKTENKKWGGIYKEMNDFSVRVISKYISFDSNFKINGKPMKGVISWFQSVIPVENECGEVCLEFMFSERLKPFLLSLNEYAKIHPLDVAPMKSGYAIRMYQIFRAERDRKRRYERISHLKYELNELKALLGVADKYSVLKDFRRRILDVVCKEINTHSPSISVDFEYLKKGRKVNGIRFQVKDKYPTKEGRVGATKSKPSKPKPLEDLTWAQHKAYEQLLQFGVYEGIALKQLLPTIYGGDLEGFEDYFVEEALKHFKRWAKKQDDPTANAAILVSWWHDKGVFQSSSDVFWKIVEKVNTRRKKLSGEKLDNRLMAKGMSKADFVEWYKKSKK